VAIWNRARYFNPIGLALGIMVGVVMRNIPVGVAIGLVLAFAIGAINERRRRRESKGR
jgi:hypothetical protein